MGLIDALYVRVSTDAQAEKGYSVEAQLDKLKAYCNINDITEFREYIDAGYSASNLERPEMQRLIQDIKAGLVRSVIVYKLDRLSRKTKDTLYLVEDVFLKFNVKFVSLSESIDTSTSSGKFFLSILSSVAQLERENIRERGMLGMRKKAGLGIKSRTPKLLVGYDYDEGGGRFVINDYEAMQIKEVFARYLAGESIGNIFRYLRDNHTTKFGKWKTIKSVQLILDNETYLGKMKYQNGFVECNNIPPIVDAETFEKVRQIREYKKAHYYRHTSAYLLTGLIFCGHCGARLRGIKKTDGSAAYYACYSRDDSHPHMRKIENCTLPYFREEVLNEEILRHLEAIAANKTYYNEVRLKENGNAGQIQALTNEIKKLSEKSVKIVDLLIEGGIEKELFTPRLLEINKQKEKLEAQLLKLRAAIKPANIQHSEIKNLVKLLRESDTQERRRILALLIKRIVVYSNRSLEIEFNF